MSLSAIIGIGGHALLLSAIIFRLALFMKMKTTSCYILAILTLALALAPIGSVSAIGVSRGIFGDLSIISIVLLIRFLILPMASREQSRQMFILVIITGVMFYPAALGIGMIDPYQWGYLNAYRGIETPLIFLASLIALLLFAGRISNTLITLCITLALAAFMSEAMESKNIWDYLIDPLVFIYGLVSITIHLIQRITGNNSAKKYIPT